MKLALNLLKYVRFDQAGNWNRNNFLIRLALARARRGLIELPLPDIDRVGQDFVNGGNPKALASPGAMAVSVKPLDNFFDTERTRAAVAVQVQLINEPDRFDFDRVHVQLLLDFLAALLSLNQLVAEGRRCSVPEPLARVFLHGPDDVLGVFLGLVFVEQGNDLAHHGLHRLAFVAHRLSDRDDLDAVLAQLSKEKLLFERLAKEPAVAMNKDQIERLLPVAGTFDHLLEDWSAVVTGGSTAFDELGTYDIALAATPSLQLASLVGN